MKKTLVTLIAAMLATVSCGVFQNRSLVAESDCSFDVEPSEKISQWAQDCPTGQQRATDNGNPMALIAKMAEDSKAISVYIVDEGFESVEGEHLVDWDVAGNLLVLVIDRDALPLGTDAPLNFTFDGSELVCEVGASRVLPKCDS